MKRGSMTVSLSLVLLVILSLFAATLRSARIAAARVALASGTEQALYSLFGSYDRGLFEKYGLLFVDAGYGTGTPDLAAVLQEVEEGAACVCQPNKGRVIATGRDILGIRMTGASVLSYTLATDTGGDAFRRQVCEVMRKNLGSAGLAVLKERLLGENEKAKQIGDLRENYSEDKAEQYYAEDRENFGEAGETEDPAAGFENPLASVRELKKLGLLGMAVPRSTATSSAEVDREELVSRRELQKGLGFTELTESGGDEKFLLLEYLLQFFPSYTDEAEEGALRYQVEYAIGEKDSDVDNLKAVIRQLLLIREASNMIHLMTDPGKRARADAVATTVSFLLLNPEAAPAISFLIKTAWAYAESVMDVRRLLSGDRIPLLKTADTWQVGLTSIGSALLGTGGEVSGETGGRGLDYEEYLRLLLLAKSADKLTASLMDLVEMNIRQTEVGQNFRLDACLAAIEVELCARVGSQELVIDRRYSYEE